MRNDCDATVSVSVRGSGSAFSATRSVGVALPRLELGLASAHVASVLIVHAQSVPVEMLNVNSSPRAGMDDGRLLTEIEQPGDGAGPGVGEGAGDGVGDGLGAGVGLLDGDGDGDGDGVGDVGPVPLLTPPHAAIVTRRTGTAKRTASRVVIPRSCARASPPSAPCDARAPAYLNKCSCSSDFGAGLLDFTGGEYRP